MECRIESYSQLLYFKFSQFNSLILDSLKKLKKIDQNDESR